MYECNSFLTSDPWFGLLSEPWGQNRPHGAGMQLYHLEPWEEWAACPDLTLEQQKKKRESRLPAFWIQSRSSGWWAEACSGTLFTVSVQLRCAKPSWTREASAASHRGNQQGNNGGALEVDKITWRDAEGMKWGHSAYKCVRGKICVLNGFL